MEIRSWGIPGRRNRHAKRTTQEQRSRTLIRAGYLGGLETAGKTVPVGVSTGPYFTLFASLLII
jgi:hypothetical protein